MNRFNHDANTLEEARNYIKNRAIQLLRLDYKLLFMDNHEWGVSAYFKKGKTVYQSIYILKDFRGKGIYKTVINQEVILTSIECNLSPYLQANNINHIVESLTPSKEYELISNMYQSQTAKRTSVYYMNHVDEGLAILEWIGASLEAKKAYCIHPLYQGDSELFANQDKHITYTKVMMVVMEYRSVANDYLSTRDISNNNQIRLSPLKDVNDMLIADKIQNYKDFEIYHQKTHPRSLELTYYFKNWLDRLGISEEQYYQFKQKLIV